MAEYIDRNALFKDIDETVVFSTRDGRAAEMRGARKIIYRIIEAPAVDIQLNDINHLDDKGEKVQHKDHFKPVEFDHFPNVGKMASPWFDADDKEILDKVLNLHKEAYPKDMDVELIVMIEGAKRPSTLFYDGLNFYSEEANGDICFHKVTHWMSLPAPPEKGA